MAPAVDHGRAWAARAAALADVEPEPEKETRMEYIGWTEPMADMVRAIGDVEIKDEIEPGIYTPVDTQEGFFFLRGEMSDRDLLRFPDTPSEQVVDEIMRFWNKGEQFEKHGLPHKRGILLHGPPGSGKSCTLQLIARDIIARGGVVITYNSKFGKAYQTIRGVEKHRPVVVLMEDLDGILEAAGSNQSTLLNVLDGVGDMTRVVFVATTNYIGKLQDRVANRPSRFDRRILVDHPGPASRRLYFETLLRDGDEVDLDRWVRDTDGFSLAHLKELFVGTLILENDYATVLKGLKDMFVKASEHDGGYRPGNFI